MKNLSFDFQEEIQNRISSESKNRRCSRFSFFAYRPQFAPDISLVFGFNFTCCELNSNVQGEIASQQYKIIAIITNPKNRKRKRLKNIPFPSSAQMDRQRATEGTEKHSVPIIIHTQDCNMRKTHSSEGKLNYRTFTRKTD